MPPPPLSPPPEDALLVLLLAVVPACCPPPCCCCSSSQRSGLKVAASGPHHCGSRCSRCGQTSTVVPAAAGQGCTTWGGVFFLVLYVISVRLYLRGGQLVGQCPHPPANCPSSS
jgi:hypothetical protein